MTDLRVNASVSVDGRAAAAELKKLAGDIGSTKVAMTEAQAASRSATAALKEHSRSAAADAAEMQRLRDALVAARTAEALATREHALATAAMNAHGRAAQGLANSTGQARASMANLGQQVGDVAQGIALGTPAFTILAQQGGQVAFAMSGMSGAIGRVATFLSGPWGAAILGGAIVLGSLSRAHDESSGAAEKQSKAEKELAEAIDTFSRASGLAAQSNRDAVAAAREKINLLIEEKERALTAAEANLALAESRFAAVQADRPTDNAGIGRAGNFGANFIQQNAAGDVERARAQIAPIRDSIGALRTQAAGGDAFSQAFRAAEISTDAARAAAIRYSEALDDIRASAKAGLIDQATATAEIAALMRQKKAAEDAARTGEKASRDQARAAKELAAENRDLAEAYNPLLAAQQDYAKALADIATAEQRGIASAGQAADARLAAAAKLRAARLTALGAEPAATPRLAGIGAVQNTLEARGFESSLAREMEQVLGPNQLGRELGIRIGSEFGRSALEFSQVIGNGLAGGFGRALQRSTAFGALIDRLAPGQGGIFQDESEKVIREAFRPLVSELKGLFGGEGALSKALGKLSGGAAVGGSVADLFGTLGLTRNRQGGQIGGQVAGAVGSIAFGPVGGLVGGAVGSIVGGLFRGKNPFADASITTTASGASASIFNQRGADSAAQGQSIGGAVGSQLQQIANALGADIRAGINVGSIGFSGDEYYFNPNGGDFKGAGAQRFGSADDAVAAAVASALSSGAVATSPRVQIALQRYAGNVNTAVAEALKIRDLEQLLQAQGNPFAAAFRDFERQARSRIDVAREYGFDLIEIEKLNADQRNALIRDTLQGATGSARALLDEFRFGDRAGGSVRDQLGTLGGERDRLAGLVRGGDTGQLDALAGVIRQIDDLQREAFGSTGEAAAGRANSAALLQELVDATEARVRAAAEEARAAQAESLATQREAASTLEDIFQNGRQQLDALNSLVAGIAPVGTGIYGFGLAGQVAR